MMPYTYHKQRDTLTLTSAPKAKRGRPKGSKTRFCACGCGQETLIDRFGHRNRFLHGHNSAHQSIEAMQASLRALPGGEAVYRRLRKEAMAMTGRYEDERWWRALRAAITTLEGA